MGFKYYSILQRKIYKWWISTLEELYNGLAIRKILGWCKQLIPNMMVMDRS